MGWSTSTGRGGQFVPVLGGHFHRIFQVNGQKYKLRDFNPTNMLYSTFFDGGSCPLLLERRNEVWMLNREVIRWSVGYSKQNFDTIKTNASIEKFKLLEQENEISFIDKISFLKLNSDRKYIEYLVPHNQLKNIDSKYLVLTKGDEYEFELPLELKNDSSDIYIVINGYFDLIR